MNMHHRFATQGHINQFLQWILIASLTGLLSPMTTHAGTYSDLTYASDGSTITITDCSTTATNVVIPDTIEGLPVTSIGDYALAGCASLTNVYISSGVTNIGNFVFKFCYSMDTISVDTANAYFSSPDGVLHNKDQTSLVFYPAGRTGSYAIPGTVTNLETGAFYATSLTNATVPSSVVSIGDWVFQHGTNLTAITVEPANPAYSSLDGVLFDKAQVEIIQYPAGKTNSSYTIPYGVANIANGSFTKSYNLSEVGIPNTVTNIGQWAFERSHIASMDIPDSVVTIEDSAFYFCTNLSNLILGHSLTSIGQYVFGKCNHLTHIELPSSIASIGHGAFDSCTNLTSVVIGIPNITSEIFDSFQNLADIVFDHTATNIGDSALSNYGNMLTNIVLGNNITRIGDWAFNNCSGLTSISIPDSIASIGESAFSSCKSLESLAIPDSVTSIEPYTFFACWALTNVVIGNDVTSIGSSAFQGCLSLSDIAIPVSVTTIGNSAFRNCLSLSSIEFPDRVTTFGSYVFYGCSSLYSVYFAGDPPSLGSSVFFNAATATVYYLPGTSGWGSTFGERPTALWNPMMQFGLGYGATTNGFSFNISGTTNIPIAVEACTNLTEGNWIPLQTTNLSDGSMDFIDADWTNHPSRVYRIAAP